MQIQAQAQKWHVQDGAFNVEDDGRSYRIGNLRTFKFVDAQYLLATSRVQDHLPTIGRASLQIDEVGSPVPGGWLDLCTQIPQS